MTTSVPPHIIRLVVRFIELIGTYVWTTKGELCSETEEALK